MLMKQIIKWSGGKEGELPIIHQYAPSNFNNYYEPFVGGGSVSCRLIRNPRLFCGGFNFSICFFEFFLNYFLSDQTFNFVHILNKVFYFNIGFS